MDFAKKQLEKYGWQEGKGLGRHENGISTPLLPKLKFDHAGIGHDLSEEFTNNWWENLYNNASSNVEVISKKGKVKMQVKERDGVEISTKSYSLKNGKKENNLEYGNFIKTSKLIESGIVDLENSCRSLSLSDSKPKTRILNDEELFAVCGGRTAHKSARHGLKLNGKLARIEKQEKLLLKKLKTAALGVDNALNTAKHLEKKLKKLNHIKIKEICENTEKDVSNSSTECTVSPTSRKSDKKLKRERKRVSFSENVTEYQTFDSECNVSNSNLDLLKNENTEVTFPIVLKKQVKLIDRKKYPVNRNLGPVDEDEGIDCSEAEVGIVKLDHLSNKFNEANAKKHLINHLPLAESINDTRLISMKRKFKMDLDFDKKSSKKRYYDCKRYVEHCQRLNARRLQTFKTLERVRTEMNVNHVAQILGQFCKISDTGSK